MKKQPRGFTPCPKTGFTLAELLIVVVIIAVLASLILPRFAGQAERAKAAEAVNVMSAIRRGLLAYYDEHMAWPATANMITLSAIKSTVGLEFTAVANNWDFSATPGATTCVITSQRTGYGASYGTITLDVQTGQWCGTNFYHPTTGKYWPNLQPVAAGC